LPLLPKDAGIYAQVAGLLTRAFSAKTTSGLKGAQQMGACRVRVMGLWCEAASGLTYDLSRRGVGFVLLRQLPVGTKALVERVVGVAPPICATVIRHEQLANGWFHGCRLAAPLREEELALWLR
jgi:hypothetical protein